MEDFEVIVVGGGLSGLSAAYCLAKEGVGVLVIERGDYFGAKNVTGGRLYLNPIRNLLPVNWEQAPLERCVTKEKICLMGEDSSVSIELSSQKFGQKPYHSFTVLRAKFDQWLAEKVKEAGAMVVTKIKVDDLILDGGKVRGIIAGEDKIPANVVLAADGVMSLIAQKAGLKNPLSPIDFAVGIKEVIELSPQTIEQRFSLKENEGLAQVFAGAITKGMFGGGFLYTNKNSVSLGLVVKIDDLMKKRPQIEAIQIFEDFKQRQEIQSLIDGGDMVEYSAHVLPEAGFNGISHLYSDGILVAGDAAGFTLNNGLTVRGMEFAIASGVLSARAINAAIKRNDFSSQSLAEYENLLKDSFVLKDLKNFRHAPNFLDNPRLMTLYPQMVCDVLEKIMYIGDYPKEKLSKTAIREIRSKIGRNIFKDGYQALRI
ncbi:MAG: FAD-dependent oxidoreductase [Dehalococcoidia bacterium]